jgi:hypothetical protein
MGWLVCFLLKTMLSLPSRGTTQCVFWTLDTVFLSAIITDRLYWLAESLAVRDTVPGPLTGGFSLLPAALHTEAGAEPAMGHPGLCREGLRPSFAKW